jgi:hypothetical protein
MKVCKKHDEKLPCKECVSENANKRALAAANRIASNLGF